MRRPQKGFSLVAFESWIFFIPNLCQSIKKQLDTSNVMRFIRVLLPKNHWLSYMRLIIPLLYPQVTFGDISIAYIQILMIYRYDLEPNTPIRF